MRGNILAVSACHGCFQSYQSGGLVSVCSPEDTGESVTVFLDSSSDIGNEFFCDPHVDLRYLVAPVECIGRENITTVCRRNNQMIQTTVPCKCIFLDGVNFFW